MEQAEMILCDTDVIIAFYKNDDKIVDELRKIGQSNIAISTVTAGELIFGALNKKELDQIKKDVQSLSLLNINEKICNTLLELMSNYTLSHSLSLPDGFIAATALENDIPLYSLNKKDFKFIKGLRLYEV